MPHRVCALYKLHDRLWCIFFAVNAYRQKMQIEIRCAMEALSCGLHYLSFQLRILSTAIFVAKIAHLNQKFHVKAIQMCTSCWEFWSSCNFFPVYCYLIQVQIAYYLYKRAVPAAVAADPFV